MIIRILSDLHTEFGPYQVESTPEDFDTTLILAGDIGLYKHVEYAKFIQELAGRFCRILMVSGNHEFYSGKMYTEQEKFESRVDRPNVHIMHNDKMVIDGILFVGGTLWTNYRNGDPIVMWDAEQGINDYKKIRVAKNGYRKLRATDVLAEHHITHRYIVDTVEAEKDNYEKIVVITHHAPSRQSVECMFKNSPLNDAYVNDFDYWIDEHGPDLWIHGHVHQSWDYMIGNTRILCNPKGYPREGRDGSTYNQNADFEPTLRIEL